MWLVIIYVFVSYFITAAVGYYESSAKESIRLDSVTVAAAIAGLKSKATSIWPWKRFI